MTFDASARDLMTNAQRVVTLKMALHTGDPGTGAANEVSGGGYARQSCSWAASSGGIAALAAAVVFNVPAATITHVTLWSSDSLTRYAKVTLSPSVVFGSAGLLTVNTATLGLT